MRKSIGASGELEEYAQGNTGRSSDSSSEYDSEPLVIIEEYGCNSSGIGYLSDFSEISIEVSDDDLNMEGNEETSSSLQAERMLELIDSLDNDMDVIESLGDNDFEQKDTEITVAVPAQNPPSIRRYDDTVENQQQSEGKTQRLFSDDYEFSLSPFDTEVEHSKVDSENRILTLEQFTELPLKGKINPYKLRYAQPGANKSFREKDADGSDITIEQTVSILVENPNYKIPRIQIGIHNRRVYSFDTRRLIAYQKAKEKNNKVEVYYKKIKGNTLQDRVARIFADKPWNGLVVAIRHGGKGSETEAYANPAYRAQLEAQLEGASKNGIFTKNFATFPNERSSMEADNNGFLLLKKQARKFLNTLSKAHKYYKGRDLEKAKRILQVIRETKRITAEEGWNKAAWYLLDYKVNLLLMRLASSPEKSDTNSEGRDGGVRRIIETYEKSKDTDNKKEAVLCLLNEGYQYFKAESLKPREIILQDLFSSPQNPQKSALLLDSEKSSLRKKIQEPRTITELQNRAGVAVAITFTTEEIERFLVNDSDGIKYWQKQYEIYENFRIGSLQMNSDLLMPLRDYFEATLSYLQHTTNVEGSFRDRMTKFLTNALNLLPQTAQTSITCGP